MTPHSRRVFLGGATAMVAAGAGTLFPDPVIAQNSDPVVRELRRQLRVGVRQMSGARPGEGARAVSAALAFGAVYARSIGLDAQLRPVLRRAGKRRLTEAEVNLAHVIGIAGEHGMSFTESSLPPLADLVAREKVYDRLVAEGLTARLEREAQWFAGISPELDKLTGMFRPVIDYNCQPIMDNIQFWSGVVTLACGTPLVGTLPVMIACSAAAGTLAGHLWSYRTYCR